LEPDVDNRFLSPLFPRASKYHPDWIAAGVSGGANSLWLTEWLTFALDLKPGMRVLDLGCGRALSSIFLHREFGVTVFATDLWFSSSENRQRIEDAGLENGVIPIAAEARSLPFATQFFDAIISIDSFFYYGTDDHYLAYLARFLKPNGVLAIAGAGITHELTEGIPESLQGWWTPDCWCLHSAEWWRRHWERTGFVEVLLADTMPDGWQRWLDWQNVICPENRVEIEAIARDAGQTMGYVRAIARRRPEATIPDPTLSVPMTYVRQPMLRDLNHSI
jgi:cyclopropane fatty-acyl-phospholipid synthase-like methyltransferase